MLEEGPRIAIREAGVSAVSVGDLLVENLHIPAAQRPYNWGPATATRLLDDSLDSLYDDERAGVPDVLGAVILDKDGVDLDVVDGQQRLLTLHMLTALLDPEDGISVSTDAVTQR